ncbi:MAG: 6-hydroxymethylpterin diphosphokinase MptE-like protein [Nitrosotalea sp.]
MPEESNFYISEETFSKIQTLKDKLGFGKKDWDELFQHICSENSISKSSHDEIEKTMERIHNESFDQWVKNFALNLDNIWSESSARDLDPSSNPTYDMKQNSAIVIGRGPSIKKFKHLERIANSNYQGSIICCDGALANALLAGITPDKFPKFYVATIEPRDVARKFYDEQIVDKYGPKIKGIFSTVSDPTIVERARQAGIKIHWLHSLFDYKDGNKSFNQISGLIVRAKNHFNGLPAIQTGGNVGTSSWFIGWQILKCATVALVGLDHGWSEDVPLETILAHGRTGVSIDMDKNSPNFEKLFPRIYNPEFDCYCILDPLYQYYSNALKEFISRSPEWLTTINATQGGSIFGNRIKCLTLENFLKNYNN